MNQLPPTNATAAIPPSSSRCRRAVRALRPATSDGEAGSACTGAGLSCTSVMAALHVGADHEGRRAGAGLERRGDDRDREGVAGREVALGESDGIASAVGDPDDLAGEARAPV